MHVIFRESHDLESEGPYDLRQDPAELVVLSFSDSDLGAFKAGWKRADGSLPSLRLANLTALKHPLSVDTYIEQTLNGAKAILIRLIGGQQYWAYGLGQVHDFAQQNGIALAVLPADGQPDARLDAASTLPVSTLRRLSHLCDQGGAIAAQAALAQLALAAGLYAAPVMGQKTVPDMGLYDPDHGVISEPDKTERPLVFVTFYRAYLTSADTDPIDRLIRALRQAGFAAYGLFATSLKQPEIAQGVSGLLQAQPVAAILNATAFSARGHDGAPSPLDAAGAPVFQIALSTAQKRAWAEAERGLSPGDLAMHVVLPEVDGRIFLGLASFKMPERRDPDLQYSRFAHQGDDALIACITARLLAWHKLASGPRAEKNLAFILSTYPGKAYQMAHAVGLDTLASTGQCLTHLAKAGYDTRPLPDLAEKLGCETVHWPLSAYQAALATLPEQLRDDLARIWGAPEDDPAYRDGAFHFAAVQSGKALITLQPERGTRAERADIYHDTERVPCHGYVAFYLWLQARGHDALIHMGAHGTLEWLPGKSVALSPACWPTVLAGSLPILYPFIVNDPGEAAQAKRRIGAVTLGHMPPPMAEAALPDHLLRLEYLLDEYATADGLDPARRDRLINDIRNEAQARGVAADLGLSDASSMSEALTRIDQFVCDIKESQYGAGLHIFGTGAHGDAELSGLLRGLSGQFIAGGPSGSPYRGRADVMPTGRNLYAVDPRAVPTRAGYTQGVKLAEEVLRQHLQDHGDYPKGMVLDLWGSATMRTAGEEFAMALHLAGIKPSWDEGSDRVSGFTIEPLALLGRPRIDVTLRVSGLFRDIFPEQASLFEQAAKALAARTDEGTDNPYRTETPRVFGPKPAAYGLDMGPHLETYCDEARTSAGEAWLKASEWALGQHGEITQDRVALEARLAEADSFVHVQDLGETDLLMAMDYASHEAGFAAAAAHLGTAKPVLYHVDATRHDRPRARPLREEIARVVHARASNPAWADSMMAHGFRGGAELAATLDHLAAFQHLASAVPGHLFDAYYDATLGRDEVVDFLNTHNPLALSAIQARFLALHDAGLWQTRRNAILAELEDLRT